MLASIDGLTTLSIVAFVIAVIVIVSIWLFRPLKQCEIEPAKVLPSLNQKTKANQIKQAIARLLHDNGKYFANYESLPLATLAMEYGTMRLSFSKLAEFLCTEYGIEYTVEDGCTSQIFIQMVSTDLNLVEKLLEGDNEATKENESGILDEESLEHTLADEVSEENAGSESTVSEDFATSECSVLSNKEADNQLDGDQNSEEQTDSKGLIPVSANDAFEAETLAGQSSGRSDSSNDLAVGLRPDVDENSGGES